MPNDESRRAFLPLVGGEVPPLLEFTNHVKIVELPETERPDLTHWGDILCREDIHKFKSAEHWLVYDYKCASGERDSDPGDRIADTYVGLNVAAPVGWTHFISFDKTASGKYADLTLSVRNRFYPRGWARLLGWQEISPTDVKRVVDGVLEAIRSNQIRYVNPVRIFENGLYSSEPYVQVLTWVMALDGLLMAGNPKMFVLRLCRLLGSKTRVFPPLREGGFVCRDYTVEDVAENMYELRSVIAHGKPIPKKFWKPLPDLQVGEYEVPYSGMPTLRNVLAEAALLLLCKALQTIILDGLMPQFSSQKAWRSYLTG